MAGRRRAVTLDIGPDDLGMHGSAVPVATTSGRRSVAVQRGASVRNQAYEALRRAIVQTRISPNQALSEKEIADAFNVSRTPVREALLRLADEGLVVIVPQQGTFTTPISVVQVREAQLTREVLERAALAIAHRVAPRDAFRLFGQQLDEQTRAAGRDDAEAFLMLDQQFHIDLAGLSGYDNLGRIATSARAHLDRIRSLGIQEEKMLHELAAEHRQVVDAMFEGDLTEADRVLTEHLRRVLDTLPHLRAAHPDFFTDESDPGPLVPLTVSLDLSSPSPKSD